MAIPKYAAHIASTKLAYYQCRGKCNGPTHGEVSRDGWNDGDPVLSVRCLKCGHVQSDTYNWAHVK